MNELQSAYLKLMEARVQWHGMAMCECGHPVIAHSISPKFCSTSVENALYADATISPCDCPHGFEEADTSARQIVSASIFGA